MAEDSSEQRTGKSLGLLTQQFVELMQNSDSGILDLKEVCWKAFFGGCYRSHLLFPLSGCPIAEHRPEAANLRYHKCPGGRRIDTEGYQEFGTMAVSFPCALKFELTLTKILFSLF